MIVDDLTVSYGSDLNAAVVRRVNLQLQRGSIVALVGESGCGKTTLARTMMGVPPRGARVMSGSLTLDGTDLLQLSHRDLRDMWGERIAYISQDPSSALNPTRRIGKQIQDPIRLHARRQGPASTARLAELLELVGLQDLHSIEHRYPRELSGGQRQRVAIAAALACDPEVLILDEPTTGLDVSTQGKLVELLQRVIDRLGMSVLWVSHDLALVSQIASEIVVMYAGEIVEKGAAARVCDEPAHPYTRALVDATPSLQKRELSSGIRGQVPDSFGGDSCAFAPRCDYALDTCRTQAVSLVRSDLGHEVRCLRTDEIIHISRTSDRKWVPEVAPVVQRDTALQISKVSFTYPGSPVAALREVDLVLGRSEIVGIVGESGSGKSTLLRVITGLVPSDSGSICLNGQILPPQIKSRDNTQKRAVQLIFQHAETALNPKHTVGQIVARPVRLVATTRDVSPDARVLELLDRVRLSARLLDRYPAELSGGQRQRLAIARALALEPQVLLCDEITSALDVSVQAAILTLVRQLVDEDGLSAIFVSHNLAAVRAVCDRTAVMSSGEVVEIGSSETLWTSPNHEYTQHLIESTPVLSSGRA
ncbi:MAG: dipeptide ABC transporter ATP-binding protein [Microbacteriaceae bacterium]